MARYQRPPDPRTEPPARRPRRFGRDGREPIPWKWLGLGVLVTILSLLAAWTLARRVLDRPPLETIAMPPAPTVIRLTAPATTAPTPTGVRATATFIPTLTPFPTPDIATPPPEITVGFYARVANTEGVGVTVRAGPATSNTDLALAPEEALLLVIGGPEEGSDLTWWQVRLDDGTEGWVAANFIIPAAAPLDG